MENKNKTQLWKYASLGSQLMVGLTLLIYLGIKFDKWRAFSTPMATWIFPLIFIIAIIIKITIDTGKKND